MDEERQEDDDQGQVPEEEYHVQGVQADRGGLRWARTQPEEQGVSTHTFKLIVVGELNRVCFSFI